VGFLLAEFDRGHIPALRRIISWMQFGAPNGATFGRFIVFGSPRRLSPWRAGRRAARRYEALSTSDVRRGRFVQWALDLFELGRNLAN